MKTIKSCALNVLLLSSLCCGSSAFAAGLIMRELRDFVPVIVMDKDELNKQLTEMQKCTVPEAIVPVLTGAASGYLYYAFYDSYTDQAVLDHRTTQSRLIALESALMGAGIHMAKQVLFRALYGNTEKAEAMNSLDTMATLATFLGFNLKK